MLEGVRRVLPSSVLPDYLKAELHVGEPSEFALLTALDESVKLWEFAALKQVGELSGTTLSRAMRSQVLSALGLRVETLTDHEQDTLYGMRKSLFSERGTFAALERLANVYFPGSQCRFGLPYKRSRMGRSAKIRLADLQSGQETVFVRLAHPAHKARCQEYLENALQLVPHGFHVRVAQPLTPARAQEKLCLAKPRSWERRLACHISRK